MSTSKPKRPTLRELGNEQFKAKNFESAKKFYTDAIKQKQDLALVHSNRSQCNLNLHLYYDALNDCNLAIEHGSGAMKTYYRRALALKELSRFRLALKDFERVLKEDPSNSIVELEINYIKKLLANDTRIDLKIYPKPEEFCSKRPMGVCAMTHVKAMGSHRY